MLYLGKIICYCAQPASTVDHARHDAQPVRPKSQFLQGCQNNDSLPPGQVKAGIDGRL